MIHKKVYLIIENKCWHMIVFGGFRRGGRRGDLARADSVTSAFGTQHWVRPDPLPLYQLPSARCSPESLGKLRQFVIVARICF